MITPNAGHEPRPKAEAQRTLEGVGSMPLFGAGRLFCLIPPCSEVLRLRLVVFFLAFVF